MNTATPCPFLRRVVMLYCEACHTRPVPEEQLSGDGPCRGGGYQDCAVFRELCSRAGGAVPPDPATQRTKREEGR